MNKAVDIFDDQYQVVVFVRAAKVPRPLVVTMNISDL